MKQNNIISHSTIDWIGYCPIVIVGIAVKNVVGIALLQATDVGIVAKLVGTTAVIEIAVIVIVIGLI